ncbi:nuclear pore complex protein DDB_G0274915 [Rhagoletis pomonella]|uniref:nuclear pore complex protein DDB_G0274915 n=1 Tax=Rhagoletis pomonella TaxID=28610 RepID=UPI00177AD60F|nr:nuclear pore complex protein DDB_G0274915 [Rhagoletis pomonella]
MDKNITMDRRFSLNMTHLPNPIAESTCLNLNGTTTSRERSSAANQFRWGGSPISTKNLSNSSINLNGTGAPPKSKSTITSPQRARMNLSKIDPRIYADVQSRGLVSRIVQYHENGSRLNRSMSASNLYGKNGHSSIAQLQKSELPYRATQQNVLMTRIAPPKKSVFYGNTLSSLLRSNSVISLQKSDEELSCENRPILHPPPTESDLAPTRSVLDVLKEISRKRINSDESDGIHDTNKKYCNRDCNDAPYEQSVIPTDLRNIGLVVPTMTAPAQSYKRQREHMVTPQQHSLQYAQNSVASATTITSPNPAMQSQRSPEQIAKKRICSYNNDITSSLSSSLIHANKRKFYEKQRSPINSSPPSRGEEYETQKTKILRQQSDLRFQQLTKSLSCNTPITPIPTTPLSQSDAMPAITKSSEHKTEASSITTEAVKRTVSEPPLATRQVQYSKPQKPKITLFNRDYNVSSSSNNVNGINEQSVENSTDLDDGECADIQFVKPKKSTAIVNKKNPLIERTQKSKLAMMLSGLRGEIYQGEEGYDQVDKISNKPQGKNAKQSYSIANDEISNGKVATTASTKSSTTTTPASTNFVMKTPTPAATSSGAPGLTTSADKTSANSTPKATTSATSASSTPTTITSPSLGGFKLTTSAVTVSSASTTNASPTATASPPKTTSPLVGLKLTPQKTALNFGVNTSTAAPNFNFGATSATSTSSIKSVEGTIATGVGAVPQLQGFSFGSTAKCNTSAPVATTATLTTAAVTAATTVTSASNIGGFNFGSTQKPAVSAASTAVNAAAPTTTAAPTFGSFAITAASTSTSASTATNKPVFAFGGAPTNTSTAVVKPSFNFGGSVTPAATTAAPVFAAVATSTFTFGTNTNSSTAAADASSTATSQATTTAAQPPMVFGSGPANSAFTIPTTSTAQPFAFGGAASTAQSAMPTAPKFSFGSAVPVATSTEAPATAATNLFAFGGQKSIAVTTTATATAATPFAFGASTQISATTVTTTSSSSNKPVFSFGGAGENAANPLGVAGKNNSSSGNLFAFGGTSTTSENKLFGNNTAGAINPTSTQTGAFTFGAQAGTPAFGAAGATPTASAFGVTNAPSTTPFAFGATNVNKPAVASSAPPTTRSNSGGFSFGTATAAAANAGNTKSTNIFGSASTGLTNQAAPTANTGIAKPAFNFGGAPTNTNDAAKSIFGGAATNAASNTSSTNTFGALAAANSNPGNKTFSFGSSGATSNNPSSNPFAAAASKPASGGFSFNASTTGSKQAVAASTLASNSTTPFAFGGTSNGGAAASSTAAPFSFGGANMAATANKTFTFGSSNTASVAPAVNASSIFGGGAQSAQQTSVAPFSFSAGTSSGVTPVPGAAPTVAANIFAPPAAPAAVSGAAGDRPIRRATRRLQKT